MSKVPTIVGYFFYVLALTFVPRPRRTVKDTCSCSTTPSVQNATISRNRNQRELRGRRVCELITPLVVLLLTVCCLAQLDSHQPRFVSSHIDRRRVAAAGSSGWIPIFGCLLSNKVVEPRLYRALLFGGEDPDGRPLLKLFMGSFPLLPDGLLATRHAPYFMLRSCQQDVG